MVVGIQPRSLFLYLIIDVPDVYSVYFKFAELKWLKVFFVRFFPNIYSV